MIIKKQKREVGVIPTKNSTKKTQSGKTTNASDTTATKPTVKKAASKRAPAKKKVFIEVPEDKFFVLISGEKIKHYVDLADRLEDLEQHVISHHITPFRHDFANWIKDVFEEHDLADELAKINDPEKIRNIIYKHIIKKHLK